MFGVFLAMKESLPYMVRMMFMLYIQVSFVILKY